LIRFWVSALAIWLAAGSLAQATIPHQKQYRWSTKGGFLLPKLVDRPQHESVGQYLDREILKRTTVTGSRNLGYRMEWVSGDGDAYNNLNYFGQGSKKFTDYGLVQIQGSNLLGMINFKTQIIDSRFSDPQGQHLSIDVKRGPVEVNIGDIQGRLLNTNQFARFEKSLRGVMAGYKKGGFEARAIHSEVRGSARTVTIQGNNTPGPYYLQSSQIIIETERVQVDGQEVPRGEAYTINYESGTLTFNNRIIAPTSTVIVTYEALGFNAEPGTVQGLGLSYDLGKLGKVGLTGMRQLARGGSKNGRRLEKFSGFGAASAPYFLQFEPLLTELIEVRVDGVLQTQDVDFYFDTGNPTLFYFKRFMPFESQIDVSYVPKARGTATGDRESFGFDYSLNFAKNGRFQYSQATGRLKGSTPQSGDAKGANLTYRTGPLSLDAGWRKVAPKFVSVETRGFERNEDMLDFRLAYAVGTKLRATAQHTNTSITNTTAGGTGSPRRLTITQAGLNWNPNDGTTWNLTASRSNSGYGLQSTKLDTVSINGRKSFRKVDTRITVSQQRASGLVSSGGNLERQTADLSTIQVGATYNPTEKLQLNSNVSVSNVKQKSGSGTGQDISFNAVYHPTDNLQIVGEYLNSNAGRFATLSQFQTGYGFGYDGQNGFSGGSAGATQLGSSGVKQVRISASWNPSEHWQFSAAVLQRRANGSLSANAESTSSNLSAAYDAGQTGQFYITIGQSNTRFLDQSFGRTESTTLDALWRSDPAGPWSYSLGARTLITGGSSQFNTNGSGLEANLEYKINSQQGLAFGFRNGLASGYQAQRELEANLTYRYLIYRDIGLNVGYHLNETRNRDNSVSSGAYTARGFFAELSFNFGR